MAKFGSRLRRPAAKAAAKEERDTKYRVTESGKAFFRERLASKQETVEPSGGIDADGDFPTVASDFLDYLNYLHDPFGYRTYGDPATLTLSRLEAIKVLETASHQSCS
jgi:hypothetical protein